MTYEPKPPHHPEVPRYPVYAMPQFPDSPQPQTPKDSFLDSGVATWSLALGGLLMGIFVTWTITDSLYGGKELRELEAAHRAEMTQLYNDLSQVTQELAAIRGCLAQ